MVSALQDVNRRSSD